MGQENVRRKKLYVSNTIQGVVIRRFAMYWIGYHLLLWHGVLFHGYFREVLMQSVSGSSGLSFWAYYGQFFLLNKGMVLCAVAVCPILLWDTLRVTHRIAGPIVRFKDVLKRLAQGENIKEVKLREHDLMEDLRDSFNEFLASRKVALSNQSEQLSEQQCSELKVLNQILEDLPGTIQETEETEDSQVINSI